MNRLLLVAHAFPPAPSPGALRPGYIARYLPLYGWDVTTLTTTPPPPPFAARTVQAGSQSVQIQERIRGRVAQIANNPYSPLRIALRSLKESILFPDSTALWMSPAIKAGMQLLGTERFDAILSTALPPSTHVIAWVLARRSGLPWIADYRDPWQQKNPYLHRGRFRAFLEALLERGMVARASTITTISEPIAAKLRAFHKRADVHVIPNGYDPSDWSGIPFARPTRFDLCFTGSMYDGQRSPDLLFAALADLRAAGDPAGNAARVQFYGRNSDNVGSSASHYNVNLIVRQHGVVPREEAMHAQRNAAALLIFLNMDPTTGHEMGSKYLEYLGAGRPFIVFGPSNSLMRAFIARHRLGWFVSNLDEAKEAVRGAYAAFVAGNFESTRNLTGVQTAQSLAAAFAGVLDGATRLDSTKSIA